MINVVGALAGTAVKPERARKTMRDPDGSGENVVVGAAADDLAGGVEQHDRELRDGQRLRRGVVDDLAVDLADPAGVVSLGQDAEVDEVGQDPGLARLVGEHLDRHLEVRDRRLRAQVQRIAEGEHAVRGDSSTFFVTVPISSPLAVAKLISR